MDEVYEKLTDIGYLYYYIIARMADIDKTINTTSKSSIHPYPRLWTVFFGNCLQSKIISVSNILQIISYSDYWVLLLTDNPRQKYILSVSLFTKILHYHVSFCSKSPLKLNFSYYVLLPLPRRLCFRLGLSLCLFVCL